MGRSQHDGLVDVLRPLLVLLQEQQVDVLLEDRLGALLPEHGEQLADRDEIGRQCDLVIVIGGDGSLLGAARSLARHDCAVLGINRGRLGFLTDIRPAGRIDTQIGSCRRWAFAGYRRIYVGTWRCAYTRTL